MSVHFCITQECWQWAMASKQNNMRITGCWSLEEIVNMWLGSLGIISVHLIKPLYIKGFSKVYSRA